MPTRSFAKSRTACCEVLKHDGISLTDIMARYFSARAPFSEGGAKKDEFPDAVTLMTLENWAEHHNYRLLAISGDKDWQRFAETSEWIDVVKTIADALNVINEQSVEAKEAAIAALRVIATHANPNRSEEMQQLLSNAVERQTPWVECDSDVAVEADNANLVLIGYELVDIEEAKLVRTHGSDVTIEDGAEIKIDAHAPIYFSAFDRVDGDYVSIGGSEERLETTVQAKLLVSISLDGSDFVVGDVTISKFPQSIDFGYVEFNCSNDFYED